MLGKDDYHHEGGHEEHEVKKFGNI